MHTIEQVASQFAYVEETLKALEEEKKSLKAQLSSMYDKAFGHEGHALEIQAGKVTRVIQVRQDVIQDECKRNLTIEQFNMVKVESVDKAKLLSAIQLGIIPASVIQAGLATQEIDKFIFKPA